MVLAASSGCCLQTDTGAMATSAATGTSTGSAAGGTTGATGSIDSGCVPNADSFQPCFDDAVCGCGQWCVYDSFLGWGPGVCERVCTTNADCPNEASLCSSLTIPVNAANVGSTCAVNGCADGGGPGDACDADGSGEVGTCVPFAQLEQSFAREVCLPNGTATACTEGSNNDDPFSDVADAAQANGLAEDAGLLFEPQPRVPADFCGAGRACYAPLGVPGEQGTCEKLCAWPEDGGGSSCETPAVCVTQAEFELWWGFCLPCGASSSDGGPAANCNVPSDCCESNCAFSAAGALGLCVPTRN